jgi:hypothetical protein
VHKVRRTVIDFWIDHSLTDFVLVAVVVGGHGLIVWRTGQGDWLARVDEDRRESLYTTLASIATFVFGFATASIAFFYGSAAGRRVALLQKSHGQTIVRTWRLVLSVPLVVALACIVALIIDVTKTDSGGVRWLFEVAFALLAVELARLTWLFTSILALSALDLTAVGPAPAPALRRRAS